MPRTTLQDLDIIESVENAPKTGKKLQKGSRFEKFDFDGNGVITDAEMERGLSNDPYSIKSLMQKYDIDGSGQITMEEMDTIERLISLESKKAKEKDRDKREDAQRAMAWFALFGMLLYPFSVVIATWLGLDHAAEVLGTMANIYFVSVAAIVAAFFGAQAYTNSHSDDY
jgi:Ca2+-binding EF-hand superfamily protein